MNKLLKFGYLLLFTLIVSALAAQLPVGVNIDQLSDAQLMQYAQSNGLTGLSDAELEAKAKEKGLSPEQVQKLKARMQSLNTGDPKQEAKKDDNNARKSVATTQPKSSPDLINGLMIFGSDFFTKENLSFEPNLNIPTPRNYTIGGGDELKIDIYGFSEKSQSLKVTPDGYIRYPNIGPIKLAGLSFDEAKVKLSSLLSKIYPGLKSGNTSLQLTLGQIRTIKVNLIGEITKPGSYSLSSLSTIANALYAAGGPTKIGSYRNIELVRSGKSIARFDLYDYLLKGDLSGNKVMQDDDVIKVGTYTARIELRGAVKRPSIYELTNTANHLTDVLQYAGGLSDYANKSFYRVSRFGRQEKEVFVVKAEEASGFVLQTGDQLYIDSLSNIFKNRLSISGAVNYEGVYSLEITPTLKDLIVLAKPKEDASKERAILRRLKDGYIPEMIGFKLDDVLNGNFNLPLQKEDAIQIYSNKEIKENFQITVKGEVNKPNDFLFARGMQVQDAVLLAGGYKDGASRKLVEVARRIRDTISNFATPQYAIILSADLINNNLVAMSTLLEPFDIVSIRKAPGYKEQLTANIEGEVQLPGSYTIASNQERLSDLLKRAGGIKEGGFAEGASLVRKTFESLSENDQILLQNKISTLKSSTPDSLKGEEAEKKIKETKKVVGIRLDEVIKTPGSLYDILLEDGDIIKVPKKIETVQTFSGVYFPKKIVYRDGLTVKDIIRESGGLIAGGQRKKSYIVYPNGEVRSTKSFLFVRSYPKVKPGSEIYVPVKEVKKGGTSAAEIVALSTGLATLFLIIKSL